MNERRLRVLEKLVLLEFSVSIHFSHFIQFLISTFV